jgi:tRNA pseudouridine synthase 10
MVEIMEILDIAKKILQKGYACDHCLGRQFAQLLSGFTNEERGRAIRLVLAMQHNIQPLDVDTTNFHNFKFRNLKVKKQKPGKCYVCNNVFEKFEKFENQLEKKLTGIEFKTFLVGTKLSSDLIEREEDLWENIGITYCEPIKAEINREFGKLICEKTKKDVDEKNPDINIILNLEKNKVEVNINPIFVFGKYKKLVRGIPQTKWDMYDETVEDIIAKPFMKLTKGKAHSFHGAGREDIDARCLDWRPFVFEVKEPIKRSIDLKKIEKEANKSKKVQIGFLRFSNKEEVRKIKNLKLDKTYRVVAVFEKPLKNLDVLKKIKGEINQKTPTRVLHRRGNILRKRKVKSINWKKINEKTLEFEIRAESGLYVKELITGDDGRTKPSVSELLNNPAKVKELDVIKIWE